MIGGRRPSEKEGEGARGAVLQPPREEQTPDLDQTPSHSLSSLLYCICGEILVEPSLRKRIRLCVHNALNNATHGDALSARAPSRHANASNALIRMRSARSAAAHGLHAAISTHATTARPYPHPPLNSRRPSPPRRLLPPAGSAASRSPPDRSPALAGRRPSSAPCC